MTTSTKPQGRDEIRTAVIAAARTLVAERGPDGFTVREIAGRAGVNHALVHRHFGTKADVLEQVLAQESRDVAAALSAVDRSGPERVAQMLDVLAAHPTYARAIVHAVLEAPDVAVPGTSATTELFTQLWRSAGPERATASAVAGATALGWLIFGEFMSEVAGADREDVRRETAAQVAGLTER